MFKETGRVLRTVFTAIKNIDPMTGHQKGKIYFKNSVFLSMGFGTGITVYAKVNNNIQIHMKQHNNYNTCNNTMEDKKPTSTFQLVKTNVVYVHQHGLKVLKYHRHQEYVAIVDTTEKEGKI